MTEYQMMDDFLNDDDADFISEFTIPSSKNFETVFMKIWLIIGLLMIGYVAPTFALLGLLYLVSIDWSIMMGTSSKPVFEPAYSTLDDDENGSVESEHDHHLDHNNNNNLQMNNNHRSKTDHNKALDAVHTHRLTIEEISMKLCD